MATPRRVYETVLTGRSDANIRFDDLRKLLKALGFDERTKGSHRIFTRADVEEIINLQPLPSGRAKPYQVRQVRQLVTKYQLGLEE
jgi:predicted RNA binding protein YcfA (HicA-like mRNA interferase family)